MDFFAAGGFQQLFSDLNDTQLYSNWTDINAELEEGPTLYGCNYYTQIPLDSNMQLTCSNDPFVYASSSDGQRLTELHIDWDESGTEVSEIERSECSKSNEKELQRTLDRLLSSPAESSLDGSSSTANSRPQSSPAESSITVNDVAEDLPLHVSSASDPPANAAHPGSSPASLTHCDAVSLTQANSSAACKLNKSYNYNNLIMPNDLDSSILVEFETAEYITREMSDWEEKFLDNYIEIDELIDFLPEKTPLCTETCEHFLIESSKNLKLHRRARVPKRVSATSSQADQATNGYPCTFATCDKVYAKPAHLKAHMRRHMGEKPYTCDWPACTWKFSRSDELARHRRSHSGVKPYKCNYCLKCFARSDHLTKHRKVHERRLLAASKAGKAIDGILPHSVLTVRPGRKRKNQL